MKKINRARIWLWRLLHRLGLRQAPPVYYIGGSESLPAPLTPEQEQYYLSRYTGSEPEIRQVLIEHNLRLVVYIARKFENTGIGIEDLISIGNHRADKIGQHLPGRQKHQARDLCFTVH